MSEHFVTVFNHKFLPQAMALHNSMLRHCEDFILWVICVDDLVADQIETLGLEKIRTIKVSDLADTRIDSLRDTRSLPEFCWTLTPLSFSLVWNVDPSIERITYLDADLFFYKSPKPLFEELENSGKQVLITEHAYDPRDDRSEECGRFCVQFVTFYHKESALTILQKWQDQCIESCSSESNDSSFGDQKYLDTWPDEYYDIVHILQQRELALGPWNADYLSTSPEKLPVFYHFHSFRIISKNFFLLLVSFKVKKAFQRIYPSYCESVIRQLKILKEKGIEISYLQYPKQKFLTLFIIKRILFRDNIFKWYKVP